MTIILDTGRPSFNGCTLVPDRIESIRTTFNEQETIPYRVGQHTHAQLGPCPCFALCSMSRHNLSMVIQIDRLRVLSVLYLTPNWTQIEYIQYNDWTFYILTWLSINLSKRKREERELGNWLSSLTLSEVSIDAITSIDTPICQTGPCCAYLPVLYRWC